MCGSRGAPFGKNYRKKASGPQPPRNKIIFRTLTHIWDCHTRIAKTVNQSIWNVNKLPANLNLFDVLNAAPYVYVYMFSLPFSLSLD